MGYLGRDVEVVSINQTQYLVASCDSCGAIGMKDLDVVKISWSITGRLTTRVALLEVLATGAVPQMITVAISNELHPTGDRILEGVKEELESAGLMELPMAISTEKNMFTQQTGLGISVIGVTDKKQLRIGTAQSGDDVYCLGLPKVGPEVTNPEDSEIVQVKDILFLLDILGIHDIIPVGSRGIRTEAQQLATRANCRLSVDPACVLNLDKSAGPSTCLIFSSGLGLDFSSSGWLRSITKVGKLD
ncbi:MAG: alpha-ribazole kinase [Desulfosporosinus sp.]|nr:alpha-ribazole kinase [Desulfosporosinus sp.]